MTERSHSFHPLRFLRQAGKDTLLGGRRKRVEGSKTGIVVESRFRDGLRAFAPGAVISGMAGAIVLMAVTYARDFSLYVQSNKNIDPTAVDMNGWIIVGAGIVGALVGGAAQAEHSRRLGSSWETDSEIVWGKTEQSVEGFINKYR